MSLRLTNTERCECGCRRVRAAYSPWWVSRISRIKLASLGARNGANRSYKTRAPAEGVPISDRAATIGRFAGLPYRRDKSW